MTDKKPWAINIEDVYKSIETKESGLDNSEVEKRKLIYGPNSFRKKEGVKFFPVLLDQFASPLIFLLIFAAVLSGILGKYIDMMVVILAVGVNAILGFYREYHAESTLDKLTTYIKDRARVIRGGNENEIDSTSLVPGDLVKLSFGSRVPADCRITHALNFRVDEAILTGESMPVLKNTEPVSISSTISERHNMAYAGTLVVEGYATAVVFGTGDKTEIGKIAKIVGATERAETPIQKGVKRLAWVIFCITVFIVCGVFGLGLLRGVPIIEMLLLSSAVAVGAVPEALPIALTVILAIGAERIANKKGIVRKLAAAETLGSTTLIMTDKTGTLTKANMELVGIYSKEQLLKRNELEIMKHFSDEQKDLLLQAIHNIDIAIENIKDDPKDWIFHGRPFEVNIAKAAVLHNVEVSSIKNNKLILPFNSSDKFSLAKGIDSDHYTVMGAPDILLQCSKMSKEEYIAIEEWIRKSSYDGNRLIGLAKAKVSHKNPNADDVKDLEFMGIISFVDPIRDDVVDAVNHIQKLGVKIVLITGDLKGTALSLTKNLGWEVKEEEVLTGKEINSLDDGELLDVIDRIKVYARVTPEDKLRVGNLYRKKGEIVAMTGDGVNDSPALKAMDIGISLGSGSDVAKSAADMVLLDDNFKVITLAIIEGRKIIANIRKVFVYLMSNSLDEVFVIGGSLLLSLPVPLTALQIIWVNFITGSLPALAFAFDQDLDKKRSSNTLGPKLIFTKEVTFLTFGIGVASSLLLFFLYYTLIHLNIELDLAKSIFFVCFASYILAITYSFRSLYKPIFSYNIFSNKKLNLSILVAVVLISITIGVPAVREQFGLVKIPFEWAWLVVLWLALNVLLVELAKLFFRMAPKSR